MKVLVCGSRKWADYEAINTRLDELDDETNGDIHIITGTALTRRNGMVYSTDQIGADQMAAYWAWECGADCTIFEADWDEAARLYGWNNRGKAGPIRNTKMAEAGADLCIAFRLPGKSNGTDDMVRKARARNIPVEMHGPAEAPK